MAETRLGIGKRKFILKGYISEVQRQFRIEFENISTTRLTISRIRDKFEANGTLQNVHKQRSGRYKSRSLTNFANEEDC